MRFLLGSISIAFCRLIRQTATKLKKEKIKLKLNIQGIFCIGFNPKLGQFTTYLILPSKTIQNYQRTDHLLATLMSNRRNNTEKNDTFNGAKWAISLPERRLLCIYEYTIN